MIEQSATVKVEDGEFVWVEAQRGGGCQACAGGQGCGAGTLARAIGGGVRRIRVRNAMGCRSGDVVLLGMDEQAILRGSLLLYAVPVLAMLAGAVVAELGARLLGLPGGDAVQAVGAIGGLAGGFLHARRYFAGSSPGRGYEAVMLRILQRGRVSVPVCVDRAD
jgi:sigma-E factor negative regulatory protein RseC